MFFINDPFNPVAWTYETPKVNTENFIIFELPAGEYEGYGSILIDYKPARGFFGTPEFHINLIQNGVNNIIKFEYGEWRP